MPTPSKQSITDTLLKVNTEIPRKVSQIKNFDQIYAIALKYFKSKSKETRGRPSKISLIDAIIIILLIEVFPTILLREIQEIIYLDISISTLSRFFKKINYTTKNVEYINTKRDTEKYKQQVREFIDELYIAFEQGFYTELVSIDESSFTTNIRRNRGRSQKGESIRAWCEYSTEKRLTLIGAVSMSGNVRSLMGIEGGAKTDDFIAFCRNLFEELPDKSLVLLDNAKIHHACKVQRIFDEFPNIKVVFIPPYSPEFSPIENIWSIIKSKLRGRFLRKSDKEKLVKMAFDELNLIEKSTFNNIFEHFGEAVKNVI